MPLSEKTKINLSVALIAPVLIFCLLLSLAGIGIFGAQIYWWLGDAKWRPISVLTVIMLAFEGSSLTSWLKAPETWMGLHKLVFNFAHWCPFSVFLFILGPMLTVGYFVVLKCVERDAISNESVAR